MMRDLIKEIYDHKDKNDPKICFFMMEFIKNKEINSLEELKKNEEDHYTLIHPSGPKMLTDLEILDRLYSVYDNDYEEYTNSTVDDQKALDELNKEYVTTDDVDKKFIDIIKMYSILNWDLALPYRTYKYIVEDKL